MPYISIVACAFIYEIHHRVILYAFLHRAYWRRMQLPCNTGNKRSSLFPVQRGGVSTMVDVHQWLLEANKDMLVI